MNLLIFEPLAYGHHGPYLSWMAKGLADRGFDVTIVTQPEAESHPSIQALAPAAVSLSRSPYVITSPIDTSLYPDAVNGVDLIKRDLAYWRLFREWYKTYRDRLRPDMVFLPYLDYCLYAIGLLGSPFGDCPWAGLAMRPSFHYHSMGVVAPKPAFAGMKKSLFFRMLRSRHLHRFLTIDEPLAEQLTRNKKVASKVVFLPEPAEFDDLPRVSQARQVLKIPLERKLILLYGAITARKGVVELLQAMTHPEFPDEVDVLLAGTVRESGISEVLSQTRVRNLIRQGRLRIIDRFIETSEEPVLFAAADIVWMGYRGHYTSSGLLVQAVSSGRPILACEEGVIGWQTRRHNLGRTIDPTNMLEVIAAINSLLRESAVKTVETRTTNEWQPPSFAAAQNTLAEALARP